MRNRKRITILGIVLLVVLVRLVLGGDSTVVQPARADSSAVAGNKPTLILTYQNNLLSADIESATA